MKSEIVAIDPHHPQPELIEKAAQILHENGLVAFPTETVYGLGANALNTAAVDRIFKAKGRPASNPLIVHIANIDEARNLALEWPGTAQRLAEAFWPGSLTLVVPKRDFVPAVVTAGGPTVALRVPAHPVGLALIEACALPIAAPSANRSSGLSPTTAEHVMKDLNGRIAMILDGGPAWGGLESTVLDVTASPPRLLRPGLVAVAEIEAVIGPVIIAERSSKHANADEALRSPGMLEKHYAPRTPVECVTGTGWQRVLELAEQGDRIGWLTFIDAMEESHSNVVKVVMSPEPKRYAANLYSVLHRLDAANLNSIVMELPPNTDEWLAVRDRLRRASA